MGRPQIYWYTDQKAWLLDATAIPLKINSRMYTQTHTPTVIQRGGGGI